MLDAGTDNDRKIEDMQVGSKCRNKWGVVIDTWILDPKNLPSIQKKSIQEYPRVSKSINFCFFFCRSISSTKST